MKNEETMGVHSTTNEASAFKKLGKRLASIRRVLKAEYQKNHEDPWVFAFSGGKDSTLLLHLAYEVILSIAPKKRTRQLYVVSNDTRVESPLVIDHLDKSLVAIQEGAVRDNIPIVIEKTMPNVDQTFWVNVIGRGYIPPTRNFRWCTDRMKIVPTNTVMNRILVRHEKAILFIGTRRAESNNRKRAMDKRGVRSDEMNPHDQMENCRVFAPIADLEDNDVWTILMQLTPPWGGSHKRLITLYKNAGGGECPLVLTKDDAPSCGTTSPRFGCWTCTVVEKDRSLRGLINSGHKDEEKFEELARFRDWLIKLRENNNNRMPIRRNGTSRVRDDGSRVFGPFKFSVRRKILKELLALASKLDEELILHSEIDIIKEIWRIDEIQDKGRKALMESISAVAV